jgi:hypothetical protein
MKSRLVPVLVLALAFLASTAAGALTVTSPNGGESWPLGAMRPITWTADGISGSDTPTTVSILLVRNGSKVGLIAENVPLAAGSFPWTVGQFQGGTAPAGSGYSVIVSGSAGGEDVSNAPFTITSGPGLPPPPAPVVLRLTAPNGGEEWRLGSAQTISWTATNLTDQVKLELVRPDGGFVGVIASDLPASGSRPWDAGDFQGGRVTAGDYLVRVRSQAQPARHDASDGTFHLASLAAGSPRARAAIPAFGQWERVPATIQNWMAVDQHPNYTPSPPLSLIQARPVCDPGTANRSARVGRDWFPLPQDPRFQAAGLHRSRVFFPLSSYASRAAELRTARLHLKQIDSVRSNTNNASCAHDAWVLLAPWTSFNSTQLGDRHGLQTSQVDYRVEITETVRRWLDGSLANHGLLLFSREAPMSNLWTCISCYEVELELQF